MQKITLTCRWDGILYSLKSYPCVTRDLVMKRKVLLILCEVLRLYSWNRDDTGPGEVLTVLISQARDLVPSATQTASLRYPYVL
ncbi:hypothetical protein APICC_03531 [Apis cerana cerana]|uniref:Uncharacterized protein n=1 Tax=Apis cerana cerana TaxID=94128 RepID=A0A2A3EBQ9_APICC|nr:hypothetical protein APICC_03531 [Apis cerana cerana]